MNRTKEGWEEYCLGILGENRRFSVWWATENIFIANAMDRLIESGKIRIKKLQFPFSRAIIRSKK